MLEEEVGTTSPYLSKISLISGSWECGYMILFGFSLEQSNKGRGWGEFCLLCVAFLGWQSSTLTPFGPISWECLEELEVWPDASRKQSCSVGV